MASNFPPFWSHLLHPCTRWKAKGTRHPLSNKTTICNWFICFSLLLHQLNTLHDINSYHIIHSHYLLYLFPVNLLIPLSQVHRQNTFCSFFHAFTPYHFREKIWHIHHLKPTFSSSIPLSDLFPTLTEPHTTSEWLTTACFTHFHMLNISYFITFCKLHI